MLRYAVIVLALISLSTMIGCTGKPADGSIPTAKIAVSEDDARDAKNLKMVIAALEGAETFELLSIDPSRLQEKAEGNFHDRKVLGKTQIKDAKIREKLVAALKKGATDHNGMVAGCFNPRHGIRAIGDKNTIDLVICFECFSAKVFIDGRHQSGFLTSASPQPTFDEVLRDAGVALPDAANR